MYVFKVYTLTEKGNLTKTAKIFKSGYSQAVPLPKELQFDVSMRRFSAGVMKYSYGKSRRIWLGYLSY